MRFQKKTIPPPPTVLEVPRAAMEIEMWPTSRPVPYPKNARKWSDRAIATVASSIREYGWQQPIVVDAKDVIVIGHLRLAAAKSMDLAEVPVHVASDLSAAQIKGLRIADNRTSQEASWDLDLLGPELLDLKGLDFDLGLTGFDSRELDELLIKAGLTDGLTDEDAVPEPPVVPVSILGDLWLLGGHRVLAGDSTSIDATQRLCGGLVDMVFTDPPYNADYNPDEAPTNSDKRRKLKPLGTIKSDKMSDEDFLEFLRAVFGCMIANSREGAPAYICHADLEGLNFRTAFQECYKLSSVLIWAKNNFSIGRKDYHWMHEPILYGWPLGSTHTYYGDRSQTSLWTMAKDDVNAYVHPTQKPVALPEKAINNSSKAGDAVLDLFGGSGSTLIACEKTGRNARLMELDPKYVDVIVTRWQAFTGLEATLEGTDSTFAQISQDRAA